MGGFLPPELWDEPGAIPREEVAARAEPATRESAADDQQLPSLSTTESTDTGDAARRDVVARMEGAFGMSFLGVSLRTDADAAEKAAAMGARAYTDGREIGFAEGAFDPHSREGLHTIAHEFAHVAQARGGTAGAARDGSAALSAPGVRGKKEDGRAEDDMEAAADAAAAAVVAGQDPNVAEAELGSAAMDKGQDNKPVKAPPPGAYYVGVSGSGDLFYSFNGDEARKSWTGDGISNAVGYYIRDAFPGASPAVIDACRMAVGLYWTGGFNPKKSVGPVLTAHVPKSVHDSATAWFAENHPEITPRIVSSGFKDRGKRIGGGGSGEPRSATTTPTGADPEVASKELEQLKDLYAWIAKTFGDHAVFGEGGMSLNDFLAFHTDHPDLFEGLPPVPRAGKPATDPARWRKLLDAWKEQRDRDARVGVDGGDPEGSPRGEEGGKAGGIIRFSPRAVLTLAPSVDKYVRGSSVQATVEFDRVDPDNAGMNIFESRASYDWSLVETSSGKVVDSGPMLERVGGHRRYSCDLDQTGTYQLRVAVRSQYFKDPAELSLSSPSLVVVTEARREREVFDALHAGKDDPSKPFSRDESTGKLVLKPGFAPLSLDDEIRSLDLQLGGLKALREQGKLNQHEFVDYTAHFEKQKAGLLEAQKRLEASSKVPSQKNPTYFVRGTYVSRETSAAMEVKAYMTQTRREKSGSHVAVAVRLIDASLDPGHPTHHEGADAEVAALSSDEQTAWARAEKNAIAEMAEHWNRYNDYPDGKVHLAIQCLESNEVVEKSIDTHHIRKTGKAILGGIAMVGGVVLIGASPFTGGSSAAVGVIFITTAAAGTAATVMSVQERCEKESTLKIDGRLALDVLQLVSTFMAAGSFSSAFKAWGTIGKGMYLGSMLGLDVAQGILIAGDVKEQLAAVEASYQPKILAATDPDEKANLERERDSALAQILGHAMLSGSFILVSVGTGVHQIRSVGRMSGKPYTVREEIKSLVDSGDPAAIRAAIEGKPVSFEEKAYLEEALATTRAKASGAGEVATRESSDGKSLSGEGSGKAEPQDPASAGQSRVSEPRPGVFEDVDPTNGPTRWVFDDSPVRGEPDGTRVIETTITVDGKQGYMERAYNPQTKVLEMRNAFLEELPRWAQDGTPMVEGKGTPTVTYLTIRQMKLLGADYSGLTKVKMSTIQNLKAIIQLHVLRARGVDPNHAVLRTHSIQYAETAILQSGHRVVGAKVTGDIWNKKLDFLMKHYEQGDPDVAARHDKLIHDFGEGLVTRDTEVWMNYDILVDVVPFAPKPGPTGGAP